MGLSAQLLQPVSLIPVSVPGVAGVAAGGEEEIDIRPDRGWLRVKALRISKAKLKPKKAAISAEMLDTANTYDDKVAVIRMIVSDEAGRVSNVFKSMMSRATRANHQEQKEKR